MKVYSKIIPNMNKVDNSFFCTSEVASGFWHPAAYFWQNDKERNERALRSYKIYTEWSKIINGIDHCMAYIDEK